MHPLLPLQWAFPGPLTKRPQDTKGPAERWTRSTMSWCWPWIGDWNPMLWQRSRCFTDYGRLLDAARAGHGELRVYSSHCWTFHQASVHTQDWDVEPGCKFGSEHFWLCLLSRFCSHRSLTRDLYCSITMLDYRSKSNLNLSSYCSFRCRFFSSYSFYLHVFSASQVVYSLCIFYLSTCLPFFVFLSFHVYPSRFFPIA